MVEMEGFAFYVGVEYEKLPSFCQHCKIIGHDISNCKKRQGIESKLVHDQVNKAVDQPVHKQNLKNKGVSRIYVTKKSGINPPQASGSGLDPQEKLLDNLVFDVARENLSTSGNEKSSPIVDIIAYTVDTDHSSNSKDVVALQNASTDDDSNYDDRYLVHVSNSQPCALADDTITGNQHDTTKITLIPVSDPRATYLTIGEKNLETPANIAHEMKILAKFLDNRDEEDTENDSLSGAVG